MVSPELLRRYPFFGGLTDDQLRSVSMIAEAETVEKGVVLVEECEPAKNLYLLQDGSIDLWYRVVDEMNLNPGPPKELSAGEVNPGEIFGVSILIEPYVQNTTARAATACKVIVINGSELRKLLDADIDLANKVYIRIIHALMDQIISIRVQLAAAQF
jgi:CRP-like cAMP-binding protein